MLNDTYQRSIDYLRISITDRCNLRCVYCMPEQGVQPWAHADILRYEEIERVVRAAAMLGLRKIRLTGGEPLVRLGVVELVRTLAHIPGIEAVTMTTNGMLLSRYAAPLAEAGLQRVNVSLDTLRPDRFHAITRWGNLDTVLAGIEAALAAGLTPLKINTVVMRGQNDDEVVELARRAIASGWHLRFIEWMPVGEAAQDQNWRARLVTAAEIRARIEAALGPLEPVTVVGAGPARTYCLPGTTATLGFISAVSEHFCGSCNRLRLTADGKLRPCLLSPEELDLRTPLRQGASEADIQALLQKAVRLKPQGHQLADHAQVAGRAMAQIGG
ncbi:MAG TPA: GTP 3',8-cyclase MoaA [Anaerolineae bacterium]|nr:GTP 3',8-cyclase MoaA [Anaerolineae bacterium]HQK13512.1 GTP 3',8-cyclase MoaA [Anaerolineae bacterium]